MTACASLAMYDLPELQRATDSWWQGLAAAFGRAGLKETPPVLDRARPAGDVLRDPALLLGQTCGYPLLYELQDVVQLIATPVYEAAGCSGALYSSAIVVRQDERASDLSKLAGRVCAINGRSSQSGYNALRRAVAEHAAGGMFFSRVLETGGHAASLAAVAQADADVAAIDGVTHALLQRVRPKVLQGLRVLCWTRQAPGLPYVTSGRAGPDRIKRLKEGLQAAVSDPVLASARDALLLKDFAFLPLSAYRVITDMVEEAATLGYPELA